MTTSISRFARTRAILAVAITFVSAGSAMGGCGKDETQPAATSDAATSDVDARIDAGIDATFDAEDGSVCAPRDVAGFTSTWTPPIGFHQGKCSTAQITTLSSCLRLTRDEAVCDAFFAASENADCMKCASAPENAFAGCIALATGDLGADGCGAKYMAVLQCTNFACASCPLVSPLTPAADAGFTPGQAGQCASEAQNGVCKSYLDAAACARGLPDAGPAGICVGRSGSYFIDLFCGADSTDAGLDAPADG